MHIILSVYTCRIIGLLVVVSFLAGALSHEQNQSDTEHYVAVEDVESEHESAEHEHETSPGDEEPEKLADEPSEESKARLGEMYERADADSDGRLTEEELTRYVRFVHERLLRKDTDKSWAELIRDTNETEITWESYAQTVYGRLGSDEDETTEGSGQYGHLMKRDRRRWLKADLDSDGKLSLEEFHDFVHPEESERMKETIVEDTLDTMDKNKDGYISMQEYFEDIAGEWGVEGMEEADWLKAEREEFTTSRDKNRDGKLDREEILDWILPRDLDIAVQESKHLLEQADSDQDGGLTKEEVLNKYEVFVGSQATEYGEILKQPQHDEL